MLSRQFGSTTSKLGGLRGTLSNLFFNNKDFSSTVSEASFDIDPFKLHLLEEGPKTTTTLERDDALAYYRQMVVVRRMETAAANLYKEKAIRGFCHLYSGQEAVCTGVTSALRDQDTLITSYRAHGFTFAMGVPVLGVLAELTGKQSGCVRGKGGSMHMYARNFYGGNGIVGAQAPLGTGIAFAHKYRKDGGVNFCFYGDGAAQQGQVYESYNLAKLWKLPVVFICENNHYGMGTSQDRAAASTTFYTRGDYIPGVQIDGMDVLAVREATRFAIDYCSVRDQGPLVFEVATYRYHGHSMSDPGTSYRTRDEVQNVRQTKDPITGFREKLVSSGLASAEELKEMEGQIRKEVDADVKKAKSDTEIDASELYNDIYEKNVGGKIRGLVPWEKFDHKKTQKAINV